MKRSTALVVLLLSTLSFGFTLPDPGHSHIGVAFDEGPRQFAKLLSGIPDIHFKAEHCSADAQAFINQGIGQLHGFLNYESERSFRQAAFHDSQCALAFWGMAMANTLWAPNPERAKGFIEQARSRLNADSTQRENIYVESIEEVLRKDEVGYVSKLREVFEVDSEDIDAKAFFAVEVWARRLHSAVGINGNDELDQLAREVLAVSPNHPVHHYLVHFWDDPVNYPRALDNADHVGFSGPGVAHLWHMAGHTYSQGKLPFEAWWSQEAAARTDNAYMQEMRVFPFMLHNNAHNNEWLSRTLMDIGAFGKALQYSLNMLAQPKHPKFNDIKNNYHLVQGIDRTLDILERGGYWNLAAKLYKSPFLKCDQFLQDEGSFSNCVRVGQLTEIYTGENLQLPSQINNQYGNEISLFKDLLANRTPEISFRRLENLDHLQSDWGLFKLLNHAAHAKRFEDAMNIAKKLTQQAPKNFSFQLGAAAVAAKAGNAAVALEYLNKAKPLSQEADLEAPFIKDATTALKNVVSDLPDDWRETFTSWRTINAERPKLADLGPLLWKSFGMDNFQWVDKEGVQHDFEQTAQGKPALVVFLLAECPMCDAQYKILETFQEKLEQMGIALIAVTSQPENMPAFKKVAAYDDFESLPIHGLYFVDQQRNILWQDLSATAFMEIDFLMNEINRLTHPFHQKLLDGKFAEL